ncbi:hypothetical protein ALC57_06426 [Trachymyrmex cornetzi]|uniref:Uncharacterized protein n=1 Tax=Trachymyrmex cornetzi TaxID=471704 RepID=A0A151J8Q4_9HYME|nr:hypothetical protein ALC57_06426 [Trachymyrmex cornetzi]
MENHERVECELLEQCDQVATLVECFTWLQQCDECIEQLEELCRVKLTGAVINFNHIEPRRFLEDAREIVLERVRDAVERYGSVKVNTAFNGEFATKDKRAIKSINTKNIEIYRYTDLREWYEGHVIEPTLTSLEEFQERDSGLALSRILNVTVSVNKLNPMHAGCHVEVPREIVTKRAVISVRTTDNACFAWSVVAALYPAEKYTERESSYPHYTAVLNLASIEFPMILKDINKFERLNAMSINVYGIENKQVFPLWLTSDKKEKHVNMLYLLGHFAWIKNLSRLVSSQLSRKEHKKFFCGRTNERLQCHAMDCGKMNDCAIRLPSEDDKWLEFGNYNSIRTLGEYSDLYLKTDVLLLADIFENFRESCVASYGLDPVYYYTMPGFAWDATLKHTRIRFELLTDIDMVMFIERDIRGGLSQCSGRYAQANNKYMRSYDPSEPSTYLMYYDVNNLYGWAMCQPLPYAEFRWVKDVVNFDVSAIAPDSPTGYILEVDLEYPQRLHDQHIDLPFCPTRDKPPGKREDKLLATLNTNFKTRAKNDFEKNLYKLMNNAVFGNTMENVRNHVDVKLITKWDGRYGTEAMIAKPNFHSRSIFAENLIAVELRKLEMKFNKPIYMGMCIFDISKVCLYEFHYVYMLPLFHDKCKIIYTDTDSLIYRVECENIYETMKRDIRHERLSGGQRVRYVSREQNSTRSDEGREQRYDNDRIRWTQSEDVRGEGRW